MPKFSIKSGLNNIKYNPYQYNRQSSAHQTKSKSLASKLRGYGQQFLQEIFPGVGAIVGGLLGAAPGVFTGNLLAAAAGAYAGGTQGYHLGEQLNQGIYKPAVDAAYQGLEPYYKDKMYGDINVEGAVNLAYGAIQNS